MKDFITAAKQVDVVPLTDIYSSYFLGKFPEYNGKANATHLEQKQALRETLTIHEGEFGLFKGSWTRFPGKMPDNYVATSAAFQVSDRESPPWLGPPNGTGCHSSLRR